MGGLDDAVLIEQEADEGDAADDEAAGEQREGAMQLEEALLVLGDLVAAELVGRRGKARELAFERRQMRQHARHRAGLVERHDDRLELAQHGVQPIDRGLLLGLALAQPFEIAAA